MNYNHKSINNSHIVSKLKLFSISIFIRIANIYQIIMIYIYRTKFIFLSKLDLKKYSKSEIAYFIMNL